MKVEDFDWIANLVRQRSGVVLTRDKAYLVESRLVPVARRNNMPSIDELSQRLRDRREESLIHQVLDAMMTNESFFFRDQKPFDIFRQILLPKFMEARAAKKQIRIWSAAASSGQEAYSLAILLSEERARLADWKIEIVGTDISSEILERARSGTYTQFEVQRGLPITMLVKYFTKSGDKWQVAPKIREMVSFQELNLLGEFGPIGTFDVVFCRNVLIYFDQPTKSRVLDSIVKVMQPDGALFLGGAETVLGITNRFKPLSDENRNVYMPATTTRPV
ncbi:MAG: protein-glutamate O-methyltransferase CheR [Alphaproteobacteria bacterium]|nr:MAG: protein-glutamate O-methyltransferase CheR [Alphaproteobacteria bacterium]